MKRFFFARLCAFLSWAVGIQFNSWFNAIGIVFGFLLESDYFSEKFGCVASQAQFLPAV